MKPVPVQPGATLGVLGGGQLGRMFVHAAQGMGYETAVLDPDAASPAGRAAHAQVRSAYLDEAGLDELARTCAAITTEFENVPADALSRLARQRPVSPAAGSVAVCQDRIAEKAHFQHTGVPCAPYAAIERAEQLDGIDAALLPGILKTARLGYDGKGQRRVRDAAELRAAWDALGRVPCVLEQLLPIACELSVVVARNAAGDVVHYPPLHNLHRDGILAVTQLPAPGVAAPLQRDAIAAAEALAVSLDHVGVLCVEFFVLEAGASTSSALLANEMAPRPHNSGHCTLDACDVSQFELQVRTTAGLPLVAPRVHSAAVMLNLLGELWLRDGTAAVEPPWARVLALPGVHLHLYGKSEPRPGRKMGHLTVTAENPAVARATALEAAALLGIEAF